MKADPYSSTALMCAVCALCNYKPEFLAIASSMKVSPGDCDNEGQQEMARLAQIYISIFLVVGRAMHVTGTWGQFFSS